MRHISADYVIAGGGLSGLLLAYCLTTKFELASKQIVIIEQSPLPENYTISMGIKPHELEQLPLADTLLQTWNEAQLITKRHTHIDQLHAYRLAALNRAQYIIALRKHLQTLPPVLLLNAHVMKITNNTVTTAAYEVRGQYLFDSTSLYRRTNGPYLHTASKLVATPQPAFDPRVVVFFDTRIATNQFAAFARTLPLGGSSAVVEIRAFNKSTGSHAADMLRLVDHYCDEYLQLGIPHATQATYYVTPLVNTYRMPATNVIPLGANAGLVKRITGDGFLGSLRHAQRIAKALATGSAPKTYPATKKIFRATDNALLNKIIAAPDTLPRFYDALTQYVHTDQLLSWLNERPSSKAFLAIARSSIKLL